MRTIFIIIVIAGLLYWLSGQGVVTYDSEKAKQHINNVLDRIDPKATGQEMESVDKEINSICTELKDLSERALKLRQKLLINATDLAVK